MESVSRADLNPEQRHLLDAAAAAMENAYNPYSGFYVGAALLLADGQVVTGSNYENAAYSPCICAERTAIVRANAMGHRQLRAVAVIARGRDRGTKGVTAPCGTCRQMLFEASQIAGQDLLIILSNTEMTKIVLTSTAELLPLAFGPAQLGINLQPFRGHH